MRTLLLVFLFIAMSCANRSERMAVDVCKEYLTKILKDPESLKVYNIKAYSHEKQDINWTVEIDYGAKNGFGGMDRESITFEVIGSNIVRVNKEFNFYKKGDDKAIPPSK